MTARAISPQARFGIELHYSMRALIATSTFPIHLVDGLPRFVFDLCDALAKHCEVSALVPDSPGALRRESMGDVDVHRFRYFVPRRLESLAYGDGISANIRNSPLAALQIVPYMLCQVFSLRSKAQSLGVEVVNSHWIVPQGLSAAIALSLGSRFRHVLTVHGSDIHMLRRIPLGRWIARFVIDRSDVVFAVSAQIKHHLDTLVGRDTQAIIQPVGVKTELFSREVPENSPHESNYLLFVGRLDRIKGMEHLLRAIPRILEQEPMLRLVVVGEGPNREVLQEECLSLGLERVVRFAGKKSHAEVARYLKNARAVIVPSVVTSDGQGEGMPSVVLEAMASGTRLIATRSGGIPDLVKHRKTGWICEPSDPNDLASKILESLSDPSAGEIIGNAVAVARQHDWGLVAERYAAAFAAPNNAS